MNYLNIDVYEFIQTCICIVSRTMVAITQKQRLMGTSARNQAVTNFKNTIWGFTPFLGRKYSDPVVQEEIKRVPYQVVERPGNEIGIKVHVHVRACKMCMIIFQTILSIMYIVHCKCVFYTYSVKYYRLGNFKSFTLVFVINNHYSINLQCILLFNINQLHSVILALYNCE